MNTLGVVQYRRGAWKEAIGAFEDSMELWGERGPYDLFFLAMTYVQLGQRDRAVAFFQDAVARMDKLTPKNTELGAFRREAAALLGLPE